MSNSALGLLRGIGFSPYFRAKEAELSSQVLTYLNEVLGLKQRPTGWGANRIKLVPSEVGAPGTFRSGLEESTGAGRVKTTVTCEGNVEFWALEPETLQGRELLTKMGAALRKPFLINFSLTLSEINKVRDGVTLICFYNPQVLMPSQTQMQSGLWFPYPLASMLSGPQADAIKRSVWAKMKSESAFSE